MTGEQAYFGFAATVCVTGAIYATARALRSERFWPRIAWTVGAFTYYSIGLFAAVIAVRFGS